jgi:hypothetical protein
MGAPRAAIARSAPADKPLAHIVMIILLIRARRVLLPSMDAAIAAALPRARCAFIVAIHPSS